MKDYEVSYLNYKNKFIKFLENKKKINDYPITNHINMIGGTMDEYLELYEKIFSEDGPYDHIFNIDTNFKKYNTIPGNWLNGDPNADIHYNLSDRIVDIYYKIFCWARDNIADCVVKIPKGSVFCRTVDRFNKKQINTYSLEIPYAKKQKPGVFANTSFLANAQVAVAQPVNAVVLLKLVKDIFLFNSWPIMHLFEVHLKSPSHMPGGFLKKSQEHLMTKVCQKMRLNGIIGYDHVENTNLNDIHQQPYFVQGYGIGYEKHYIGQDYETIMNNNLNANTNQCFLNYRPDADFNSIININNNMINKQRAVVSFPEFLIFNFPDENIWDMLNIVQELKKYHVAPPDQKQEWPNNIGKLYDLSHVVGGIDTLISKIESYELTSYQSNPQQTGFRYSTIETDFAKYNRNMMKKNSPGIGVQNRFAWAEPSAYNTWNDATKKFDLPLPEAERNERFDRSYNSIIRLHRNNKKPFHMYDLNIYNDVFIATNFGSELTNISNLKFRNYKLNQSLNRHLTPGDIQKWNDNLTRAKKIRDLNNTNVEHRFYFGPFNENIVDDKKLLEKFDKLCIEIYHTKEEDKKICDINKIPDYCGEDGSFADNALIKGDITNYFYEDHAFDEKVAQVTAKLIADMKFNVNKYTIKLTCISLQIIMRNINVKTLMNNYIKEYMHETHSIPDDKKKIEYENDGLKDFIKNLLHYKDKDKILDDNEILNLNYVYNKIKDNIIEYIKILIDPNNTENLIVNGVDFTHLFKNTLFVFDDKIYTHNIDRPFNKVGLFGAYKILDYNWDQYKTVDEINFWNDLNSEDSRTKTIIMNNYIDTFIKTIVEQFSNYDFIYEFVYNVDDTTDNPDFYNNSVNTFLNSNYNSLFYGLYLKGGGAFKRLLNKEINNEKKFNKDTNRFSTWKDRMKEKIESVLGSPSDYDLNFIVNTKLDSSDVVLFNKVFNEIMYDYMLSNNFYKDYEPLEKDTPYNAITDYFSTRENKKKLKKIILDGISNKDVIVEIDIDTEIEHENAFKVENTILKRSQKIINEFNRKLKIEENVDRVEKNNSKVISNSVIDNNRGYSFYSKKESVWLSGGIGMLNTHFDLHRLMLHIPIKNVYKDTDKFPTFPKTHILIKTENDERKVIKRDEVHDSTKVLRNLSEIKTNTSIAQVELIDISTIYKDAYEANSKWQESLNMKSNVTFAVGDWIRYATGSGAGLAVEGTDVYEVVNEYTIRNVYDLVKLVDMGNNVYKKPTGDDYKNNLVSAIRCLPYTTLYVDSYLYPHDTKCTYYNSDLTNWSSDIQLFSFKAAIKDLNNNIKENLAMGMLKKIKKRQKRVAFLAQLEYIFITHKDPYIFDNKEDSGPFSLLIFNNYLDHYIIDKEKGLKFLKDINNIFIIKLDKLDLKNNSIFYEGNNKNNFINPLLGCSFDDLIKLRTFYQSLFTIIYNRLLKDSNYKDRPEGDSYPIYNVQKLKNLIKHAYNNICMLLSIPFYINNVVGKKQEKNVLIFLLNIFSLLLEEEYNSDYDVYLKKNTRIYIILWHIVNQIYYVLVKWSLDMDFDYSILETYLSKIYIVLSDYDNYCTKKQELYNNEVGKDNQLKWIDAFKNKYPSSKMVINSNSMKDLELSIEKNNVSLQQYSDIIIDFNDENEYKTTINSIKDEYKNVNYKTLDNYLVQAADLPTDKKYIGFLHYNNDLKLFNIMGTSHNENSEEIEYDDDVTLDFDDSTDYTIQDVEVAKRIWPVKMDHLTNDPRLQKGADIIYSDINIYGFMRQLISLDEVWMVDEQIPKKINSEINVSNTFYKICNIRLTFNKFEPDAINTLNTKIQSIHNRLNEDRDSNVWFRSSGNYEGFLDFIFEKYSGDKNELVNNIYIQSYLTLELIDQYNKLNKGYNIFEKKELLNKIININNSNIKKSDEEYKNQLRPIYDMLKTIPQIINDSKRISNLGELKKVYWTDLENIQHIIHAANNTFKLLIGDENDDIQPMTIEEYDLGTISNQRLDDCIQGPISGVDPSTATHNIGLTHLTGPLGSHSLYNGSGGLNNHVHGHQTPFQFGSNPSVSPLNHSQYNNQYPFLNTHFAPSSGSHITPPGNSSPLSHYHNCHNKPHVYGNANYVKPVHIHKSPLQPIFSFGATQGGGIPISIKKKKKIYKF